MTAKIRFSDLDSVEWRDRYDYYRGSISREQIRKDKDIVMSMKTWHGRPNIIHFWVNPIHGFIRDIKTIKVTTYPVKGSRKVDIVRGTNDEVVMCSVYTRNTVPEIGLHERAGVSHARLPF